MSTTAASVLEQQQQLTAMREPVVKGLKLKTVIKESHCAPIQHLDMNMVDADCRNLFATVSKDQATIYDDMHMDDHIAVVANMALSNSPEGAKDIFHACCWIRTAGITQHPYGDALLAIGGSDPFIHIISIVEAAVVGQLPLPAGASVAELSGAAQCPGLLLVLCRDGTLQLWQVSTGCCLWSCKTDAFTAAIHPQGSCILTASRTGKLSCWDLQGLQASMAASRPACSSADIAKDPWMAAEHADSAVDCIRFLTDTLVATKTSDGCMAVHSWPSGALVSSWKVPGSGSSTTPSYGKRCCFGHTKDGQYVCVGNHQAAAYVYHTATGRQVTRVEAIRVQGSVRACGLSEDCRHLVMVVGHGYVFRFEHRPQLSTEAEDGDSSDSEAEGAQMEGVEHNDQQPQQPLLQQQQPAAGQGSLQQVVGSLPAEPQQQFGAWPAQEQACTPPQAAGAEQQQQEVPGGFDVLPAGLGAADPAVPNSAGSLDAFMQVDAALQSEGSPGGSLQPQSVTDLSGERTKRQRVAGSSAEDSPLVFKPTPMKQ